jgi:tRNA (guanine-N7-)-methyltransferase
MSRSPEGDAAGQGTGSLPERDCTAASVRANHRIVLHPRPPSPDHLARTEERVETLKRVLPSLLGTRHVVTLEIGSGHGHYLTGYATAHPERFCIGIDLLLDRWERAERKRHRAAVPNLAFVRAEALEFLEALPSSVLLNDIFILFPDPWPKRRHHKNRIIQPSFLTKLAERAAPTARLLFRTDHADYFAAAKATVAAHRGWTISTSETWPFELPTVFQSRAESYQSFIAVRSRS